MADEPRIRVEHAKDVTVVTLRDSSLLDGAKIEDVGKRLSGLVEGRAGLRMVLDFNAVVNLSSAMLGVLLNLKGKLDESEGRLVLCGLSRELRRLFEMTALHRVFQFATDVNEGLTLLGVGPRP